MQLLKLEVHLSYMAQIAWMNEQLLDYLKFLQQEIRVL
jgi:hypothetical protein